MFKKNWQLKKRLYSLLLAAAITVTGIPNLEAFASSADVNSDVGIVSEEGNADVVNESLYDVSMDGEDLASVSENAPEDSEDNREENEETIDGEKDSPDDGAGTEEDEKEGTDGEEAPGTEAGESNKDSEADEKEPEVSEEGDANSVIVEDGILVNEIDSVSMNLMTYGLTGEEQWIGDTLPINAEWMKPTYLDRGSEVEEKKYSLLSSGNVGNIGQYDNMLPDWAYALCSALESNLKLQGKDVELDGNGLAAFLYADAQTKASLVDNKYGEISNDLVKISSGESDKGNIHTAMWAAATGYALKDGSNKSYKVKNFYLYHGSERNKIKHAIKERGEVVTSLYLSNDFFGTDSNSQVTYFCPAKPETVEVEHTVSIIGWDDEYSFDSFKNAEEFKKELGYAGVNTDFLRGAWLIKDAYGVQVDGINTNYYWLSYYDAALSELKKNSDGGLIEGGNTFCYSFEAEEAEGYEHTYQYDGGGSYVMYGADYMNKAVNIFPKSNLKEVLEAVSFGTYTNNASYEIQVYLNAAPAGNGNAQPVLKDPVFSKPIKTGVYSQWGYYTVDLSDYGDFYFSNRDELGYYAVEVTIVNSNKKALNRFWIDGSGFKQTNPEFLQDTNAVGQSYVWSNGKWVDFGQDISAWESFPEGKGTNIRIKAHTKEKLSIVIPDRAEVWNGEELQLKACVGNDEQAVTWTVDNDQVAAVDESTGLVTGQKAGYVNITATSATYGSDTIQLMVKDVEYQEEFDLYSNSIHQDKRSAVVSPVFFPAGYQPEKITYRVESGFENYIYVDGNQIFAPKGAGYCPGIIVTMRIEDGNQIMEKEMIVNCYQVPEEITIIGELVSGDTCHLKVLEQTQFDVRIEAPENAVSEIGWKSSDPSIVCVTETGAVTAVSPGEAVVTAFSEDDPDGVNRSVTVYVKDRVSRIVLSDTYLTMMPGESETITAQIYPEELNGEEIIWTVWDQNGNDLGLYNDSVWFNERTGELTISETPIHSVIYLYAECDGVKSRCHIKIEKALEELNLSFSNTDMYDTERTIQAQDVREVILYPYLNGELADESALLFFTSSNEKVATVTNQGRVLPRQAGTTVITAKTKNGYNASVTLVVESKYDEKILKFDISDEYEYMPYPIYRAAEETLVVCTENGQKEKEVQEATDFYWESWDETVVEVDADGKVTGKAKGYATIEAVDKYNPANSVSLEVQVKVKADDVFVEEENPVVAQGMKIPFEYYVLPQDAEWQEVYVTDYDSSVIYCENYEIEGISVGKTPLTISYDDGINRIQKTLEVIVKEEAAIDIAASIDKEYISTIGTEGCTARIVAEAYDRYGGCDDNYVSQKFEYFSENPTIAQVDETGLVTGYKKGTTVIKVRTTDGSQLETEVTVTVQDGNLGVKSIDINHNKIELKYQESIALTATILPENLAGTVAVKWTSLDETVATVDEKGTVTAVGYGKTHVVAETADGKKSAKCEIKVLPVDSQIKLLKIPGQVLENLWLNQDSQYQVQVYGSDGKDYTSYCEFTSNKPGICDVDENGIVRPVHGVEKGAATITAKLKGDLQGRKVSVKVNVVDKKQSARIRLYAQTTEGNQLLESENGLYLTSDGSRNIKIYAYAEDSSGNYLPEAKLKWTVGDKKVVNVKGGKDGTADLTISGRGNTTLTCTVQDQKKTTISIPIFILDVTPILEAENLSVNLQKEESVKIPVHVEENVDGITNVNLSVSHIKAGKKYISQGFEFSYNSYANGRLEYDSKYLQKGNYTIFIKAEMELGGRLKELYHGQEKIVKIIELPVKVIDQKPSVKLKLPNLNVFYKKAAEKIQFTTNETITGVELEDYKNNGVTKAFYPGTDEEGKWTVYATENVTGKGNYPVLFKIWLDGYTEPFSVKGQINTVVTAPKLKVMSNGLYAYRTEGGTAAVTLQILNVTDNCLIDQEGGYTILGGGIAGQDVTISSLDFYGKKNVELSVNNSSWNGKVDVKVPVTVEDASKIALESDLAKININKKIGDAPMVHFFMKQKNLGFNFIEGSGVPIDVSFYDSKGLPCRGIGFEIWEVEDNDITIRFYAEKGCKTGKYQAEVKIQADITTQEVNNSWYTKTIAINVEEKEPSVKIGLKGKIDLHNREDTYMTGMVTLSNISGKITQVVSERNDFFVEHIDGENQFHLWVDENAAISKKKQKVILDIYVDHDRMPETEDVVLKKAVDISLTESKLVWKKLEKPIVLYKQEISSVYWLNRYSPLDITNANVTITSVPKGMEAYVVLNNKAMSIYVMDASLKPGKYNIQYNVKFDLSAKDSAPIKQTLTIQVK